MPVYEYQCKACGREFEYQQRMSDPEKTLCEACGEEKLERLISRTAFQLKGSGWYKDLYSSSKPAEKSGEKSGDGATKSDAPAGDKAATPAAAPASTPAPASSGTSGSSGSGSSGSSGSSSGSSGGTSGSSGAKSAARKMPAA